MRGSSKMKLACACIAGLLCAGTPRPPINQTEAWKTAETELSEAYARRSAKRDVHLLQHKIEADGENWRVYFWDPEALLGGDATVLVDRKSGKIISISLGQ